MNLMLAIDLVTLPTLVVAALLFFVCLAFTRNRWSLLSLFLTGLVFLLYRQSALYDDGRAYGDYDFGFPFRWITTQNDSGPFRFRLWALVADFGVGIALWGTHRQIHRSIKAVSYTHLTLPTKA